MEDTTNCELPPIAFKQIEAVELLDIIPHRYPFLMLDRVIDLRIDHSVIGIKCVSFNEPAFQGHFPGRPIFPGVLVVEAMAQAAAVMVVKTLGDEVERPSVHFMSIEGAKFRRPVLPGDQLNLHMTKLRRHGTVWRFEGKARVEGKLVAEAVITAMVVPNPNAGQAK